MKQLLLSCFALLLWNQSQGQTLEKIKEHYHRFDSLQTQEKVYAQTDRSLYKPGDNIWFSVFVTNAQNEPSFLSQKVYAELYNPKGGLMKSLTLPNIKGQVRGNFSLAATTSGGQYKIRVYSHWMKNFSKANYFEKTLTIQKIVLPEVLMKLDFEREAYGAGDKVIANFEARTKDNQALVGKVLKYSVQLEGDLLCEKTATTNDKGKALLVFELPKKLNSTNNLINVQLENDGLTESISRSAPILLNQLDLQLLPEGGNLMAGYPARIAFKALNEFGRPADIKGQVVDAKGKVICTLESYHQGMGAFELTPQKGEKYSVQILEPAGIQQTWNLPKLDKDKIGLYLRKTTSSNVEIDIYSPTNQEINIVAIQKGQLFFEKRIAAKEGVNNLRIPTQNLPVGILQITLFDAEQQAHAERLVFVNKDRNLSVSIQPNKEKYSPREEVKLNIQVSDETGKGVKGNFSMAVVDDKQHTFADDKQDNILSYLLMSSELKGKVYEPNFYFDPSKEKAAKALDYLMLTQGWRRFEWQEVIEGPMEVTFKYEIGGEDEISGFLKINELLAKNQTIFLSEEQPRYAKKKALAVANTDENGFFKFEKVKLKFPAYLSANYHGEYHAISIYTYSQQGIKSDQLDRYMDMGASSYDWYYTDRVGGVDLKGVVFAKPQSDPLIGATVVLKKQETDGTGTSTNIDGTFELSKIPAGFYQVTVSFLGYQQFRLDSIEITGNQTVYLEVDMVEEGSSLDVAMVNSISSFGSNEDRSSKISIDRVEPRIIRKEKEKKRSNPISDQKVEVTETKKEETSIVSEKINTRTATAVVQKDIVDIARKKEAKAGEELINNKNIGTKTYLWKTQDLETRLRNGSEIVTDGITIEQDELELPQQLESRDIAQSIQAINGVSISSTSRGSIENNRYNVNSNAFSDFEKKEGGLYIQQLVPKKIHYSTVRKFYQPNYKEQQEPTTRTDFRKTIYWNPTIETNEKGKASVSFYNSDEVTTFRAILEGGTTTGQLGHQEQTYYSILPFNIITKIPSTLSFGDTVKIPVVLKNNTNKALKGTFAVSVDDYLALELLNEWPTEITIPADTHRTIYLTYKVGFEQRKGAINIAFEALKLKDAVKQMIVITPKGFPIAFAMSGQEVEFLDTILITDVYEGSMSSELNVYPDLMDGLMDGVESILRSPSGCFEQVSSSNYPNILALQLMEQTGRLDADVRKKALSYLSTGYTKLAAYEIPKGGGFEWYGRAPAHEGLSAYGLVQFHDMKQVFGEVEPMLIQRTQDFLLDRRDGKGGYKQNVGKYGFSGNKPALFNAYITWALSEVHTKGIDKEVETMTKEAIQSEDLYRMSLACLTHYNIGNVERAGNLLTNIQDMIKKIGPKSVKAESTVTYSYGSALNIETLSFAALAMMRSSDRDETLLVDIVKLILSKRQGGRFGSTQSTIMALKALSRYYETVSKVKEDGTIVISINNKEVHRINYTKEDKAKMTIKDLHKHFVKGPNSVRIKFEGTKNALPLSFDANWTAATPASHLDCPVKMQTTFSNTTTTVGETIRMEVLLQNLNENALPSTMAVIGIPAGLSLQAWQLKEMQENKAFGFYEIKNNKLILYYSEMEGKEEKKLAFDLKTEVPGIYTAPANAAYLYYGEEYKHWSSGAKISILP